MSSLDPNAIPIKVGITNHTFSQIDSCDTSIKLNFELYFCYEEDIVLKNFNKEQLKEEFEFPFHIQNALEISTQNKWVSYIYSDDIINISYHDKYKAGKKKIKLEKYNIICELKTINFSNLLPFNNVLIPIKIITNGCPGSSKIQFIPEKKSEIMWGVRNTKNYMSNYWMKNGYILNPYIITGGNDKTTKYSRIYFILSYKFSIYTDLIKYYFIPSILTIILILFYNMDESNFSGLFSTIVLGDIALLFILPTNGVFTKNEKSICLNILMILIITVMKINFVSLSRLYGSLVFTSINIINLLYDYFITRKISISMNNTFKNKESLDILFNKIDALDYVTSGSGNDIDTISFYNNNNNENSLVTQIVSMI